MVLGYKGNKGIGPLSPYFPYFPYTLISQFNKFRTAFQQCNNVTMKQCISRKVVILKII